MNGPDTARHLDPEEIAAYHAGELPPEDERRVQNHFVACRECADLLLDLDGLADPGFGADTDLPPNAAETVWAGVREQIRGEEPAKILPMAPRRTNPPRMWQALAATLLIATAGLSVYVVSLRRTVEELSRPQVNAPVLDLYPEGHAGRGTTAEAPEVSLEARLFTVILSPADHGSWTDYEAEISNAQGVVWTAHGLRRNAFGSFSLTLSRRALGTGEHRIRLFGLEGDKRELIGEYALQIPTD